MQTLILLYFYAAGAMIAYHLNASDGWNRALCSALWFLAPIFILSGNLVREDEYDDNDQSGAPRG